MLRPFAHPVACCWMLLRVVVVSLEYLNWGILNAFLNLGLEGRECDMANANHKYAMTVRETSLVQ